MEGRECSNTTLLIEAIALMNDAQERLEKVQSGWGMTFFGKVIPTDGNSWFAGGKQENCTHK